MRSPLLAEILKLSVEDRIALADEIYDSLEIEAVAKRENQESETLLREQCNELERRFAAYDSNPNIATPIERTLAKMKSHK